MLEVRSPAQIPGWMRGVGQIGAAIIAVATAWVLVTALVASAEEEDTARSPWLGGLSEGSRVTSSPLDDGVGPEPAPRLVMAESVSTLVIEADSGAIELVGTGNDQVIVERTRQSHSGPPVLTDYLEGGRLTLASSCGEEPRCFVDHRIIVPRDATVEVRGGRGDVGIVGMSGSVAIARSTGNVTVQGFGANAPNAVAAGSKPDAAPTSIDVHLLAGSIDLDVRRPVDRIDVSTKIGDVDISLLGGTYQIDADTAIGSVRVEVPTDATSDSTIAVDAPTGVIRVIAL